VANVALVASALRQPGAAEQVEDVLVRLTDRLGAKHPTVTAFSRRSYLYRIIDPHPF
jgi:hypothetical protein